MPRIRAVLFDYGRTLVDFDFPHECLVEVLEAFRPELARELDIDAPSAATLMEEVLQKIEDDIQELAGEDEIRDYLAFYSERWHRAGYHLSADLLYRILDEEQRCWERAAQPAADAMTTLQELRARGARTALVSNASFPPEMMRRQVAGNGIGALVDTVVFSSEIGRRKPSPEIYLTALKRLSLDPGSALFVGDRILEDYEGPRRVGLDSVLYTGFWKEPPPAGIDHISTLAEVTVRL